MNLSKRQDDLATIAGGLNPAIKFYDPLKLSDKEFWGTSNEATIGFLRHSEIKHGRVAMAAFVGYCVQSNFVFPYPLTIAGGAHPGTDLSPPEQWDALPDASKLQIIAFVGGLEIFSEAINTMGVAPHYMSGGKPGEFPEFEGNVPHYTLFKSLWDPLGTAAKNSDEKKEKGLLIEINNGRLASKYTNSVCGGTSLTCY